MFFFLNTDELNEAKLCGEESSLTNLEEEKTRDGRHKGTEDGGGRGVL